MEQYCILDFETYSPVDLKKAGMSEYARHPETEIICVAWALGTNTELAVKIVWDIGDGGHLLKYILTNKDIKLVAHNAGFERAIVKYVLGIDTALERWICTASMAAALALPRSLEGASSALGLSHQKDMEGRRLMMKYCKPRKPTSHNPATRYQNEEEIKRIMQYCVKDVEAEVELFLNLPPLNPSERKVWLMDQEINERGFLVDRELVETTLKLIEVENAKLNLETCEITKGEVTSTNQRDKTLRWLVKNGVYLPDFQAKTISDAITKGEMPHAARRILEIRQEASKTSTAKYHAFDIRSRTDGRCRDNLLYHGASTGRFSGQGVQIQNFPRGKIKNTGQAIAIIKETKDIELLRMLYGSPMEVFSSCLRGVIIPTPNKEIYCADYAAIEARVLFWVAKHEKGLEAFRENRDLYVEMASQVFGKPRDKITKEERFLGKTAILGCGYGVGAKKFRLTCENAGVEISEEMAVSIVQTYREIHHKVPTLWKILEQAVFFAIENPGKIVSVNHTSWWVAHGFLWCELPSGRRLAYKGPEIRYEETPWGEKRPKFYCWCVNSTTKKWEQAGLWAGVFTENVVQAISRDIMVDAMLRMEEAGYEIILSVHDEIVAERDFLDGDLKEFETIMATTPSWGYEIPIKVDGWVGERYRK